MDFNNLFKRLNFCYYAAYVSFFMTLLCAVMFLKNPIFSTEDGARFALENFVILYIISSIPFSLYFHHKQIEKIKNLPAEICQKRYFKISVLRIILIAFGVIIGVVSFYLTQNRSMIYCAGIAALAFIFCKPTLEKIKKELLQEKEENE